MEMRLFFLSLDDSDPLSNSFLEVMISVGVNVMKLHLHQEYPLVQQSLNVRGIAAVVQPDCKEQFRTLPNNSS